MAAKKASSMQLKRKIEYEERTDKLYPPPPASTSARVQRVNRQERIFDSMWTDEINLSKQIYDTKTVGDTATFAELGYRQDLMRQPPPDNSEEAAQKRRAAWEKTRKAVMGTNDLESMRDHPANTMRFDAARYASAKMNPEETLRKFFSMYEEIKEPFCAPASTVNPVIPVRKRAWLEMQFVAGDPSKPMQCCANDNTRCEFAIVCNNLQHPGNPSGKLVGKGCPLFPHDEAQSSVDIMAEIPYPTQYLCLMCTLALVNIVYQNRVSQRKYGTVNPFRVEVGPGEFEDGSVLDLSFNNIQTIGLFPKYSRSEFVVPKDAAPDRPVSLLWTKPVFC
jgi:hypothetical protein